MNVTLRALARPGKRTSDEGVHSPSMHSTKAVLAETTQTDISDGKLGEIQHVEKQAQNQAAERDSLPKSEVSSTHMYLIQLAAESLEHSTRVHHCQIRPIGMSG